MKKNLKKIIIIAMLFSSVICFFPKNVALPKYDEVVINVLKREPNNERTMELTEQETMELYAILEDTKGIYIPEAFARVTNRGRTMYGISIDTKKESSASDVRVCMLIGSNGQPEHTNYRYTQKNSYRFIINADDLADFLKDL